MEKLKTLVKVIISNCNLRIALIFAIYKVKTFIINYFRGNQNEINFKAQKTK